MKKRGIVKALKKRMPLKYDKYFSYRIITINLNKEKKNKNKQTERSDESSVEVSL